MTLLTLLFQDPFTFALILGVFVLSLSVHEYAHAQTAAWLGDRTAERMNRLTLNPLAHIDPLGLIMLLAAGFGWGKPVPFNPYNLRARRWGPAIVAAAGPLSNLILGTICALGYRWVLPALGPSNVLVFVFGHAAILNFVLMLFNLIPLAPLDGSKALIAALADERYRQARTVIETHGPYILIALMLVDQLSSLHLFGWISTGAIRLAQWIQFV